MLTFLHNVDPHVWLMTLPAALGLLWVRGQPGSHLAKRLWCELMQADLIAVGSLGMNVDIYERRRQQAQQVSYWLLVTALATATAASLVGYVGFWT